MIAWIDDGKGDFIMAVKCDGCRAVLAQDIRDEKVLAAAGWHYVRGPGHALGEDFCPKCWTLRQSGPRKKGDSRTAL